MASLVDLKGVPMVFSYTEIMLNNQIANNRDSMFPSKFEFSQPKEEWEDGQEEPDWVFEAKEFDAPRISFNTVAPNMARLNIRIIDGEYRYMHFVRRPPSLQEKVESFKDRTLSLLVPVKQRGHDDFSDSNFTIESIYADLSNVESATIRFNDDREVRIAGAPSAGIEGIIKRGLKDWVEQYEKENGGKLPMVFGGARIQKIPSKKYRLRPTSCAYSVTKRRDRNGLYVCGALNMLLQIDGLPIPNSDAIGAFDLPLPRSNYDEGVLVVSSYALSKKIILPGLDESYDDRYQFETRHSDNLENGDVHLIKPVENNIGKGICLKTTRIEGELVPGAYRVWIEVKGTTFHWSGPIYTTSKNHVDMTFHLENGKLVIKQGPMVNDEHDHYESLLGRILGDILTKGLDEILRKIREVQIDKGINSRLQHLKLEVFETMQDIILPGGRTGVFSYTDVDVKEEPKINGHSNLFLYARFADKK